MNGAQEGTIEASPERTCAHAGCECIVLAPDMWCSEVCSSAQQGYASMPASVCACNHAACGDATSAVNVRPVSSPRGDAANG